MDLFTEQKDSHRHRKFMATKGKKEGEGQIRSIKLTDTQQVK